MKKTSNTIVFFGSGPVAAKSLELLEKRFNIEAVITKPKPSHHRGNFPVLDVANQLKLPIITVGNKQKLDAAIKEQALTSKLAVLIDFGIIVSQSVIDYFPMGIVNSHFSLLPEWRGADPITFAILSGQKQTGVSLMLLVEAMDEGPLLAQRAYKLPETITTPELTDALIKLSVQMLEEIIPPYMAGTIKLVPQGQFSISASATPSYSRKLTKKDSIIDWRKSATEIEREVRAFIGWPGSKTVLFGKEVTITKACVNRMQGQAGVAKYDKHSLLIFCGHDALSITALKPNGKKEMPIKAFLAGIK